jgi:hypothetical protein
MYDSEEWKEIIEYEGYFVSSLGEIMSKRRDKNGKLLRGEVTKDGYARVTIMNISPNRFFIHRLVAESFIPNPENKPCVNHIDGNKLNNKISNLEWVTYSENTIHCIQNNLVKTSSGISHYKSRFNEDQIREMRKRYNLGDRITDIGRDYEIDDSVAFNIIKKKTYKNVI